MQSNEQMDKKSIDIARYLVKEIHNFFGERVDDFSIFGVEERPYQSFHIEFCAYNYYPIILNFDRGRFGCAIQFSSIGIKLKNSQEWYEKADFNLFFQELKEQIELRIPDKFLEANGWK